MRWELGNCKSEGSKFKCCLGYFALKDLQCTLWCQQCWTYLLTNPSVSVLFENNTRNLVFKLVPVLVIFWEMGKVVTKR